MQAEMNDLQTLLDVQKADVAIMRAKKQRAELPQRVKVQHLRRKREEISAKLDQALELEKAAKADLTGVEDEDRQLLEKQQRAQEIIDTAGSDYRKVESQSREMSSIAKRRDTLGMQLVDLKAKVDKIVGIREQLEKAIAASQAEEARMRASFEAEDNQIINQIKVLSEQRANLAAGLPRDLVDLYERTAAKAGGVGIGRLEDDSCGVCRNPISGGRLIELRAAAPLGTCPNCKRLLVIE